MIVDDSEVVRTKLRGAIHKAVDEQQPVQLTDVQVRRNGGYAPVAVTVKPVKTGKGEEGLLLLLDREREQLLSIGLYATAAAARTVETSGHFEQVVALLRDLFVGQPTRQIYEVLLQG